MVNMPPPGYPQRASRRIRRCLLAGLILAGCGSDRQAPVETGPRSTWKIIQEDILAVRCVNCHRAGTSFARQSGLVLTPDVAYRQLVGNAPANSAARADGLVLVSDLGGLPSLFKSYLWEKINVVDQEHFYGDHPYYGSQMPLGGLPLTNGELVFIRAWIEAGAPETGVVADPELLADRSHYERPEFRPPPEPENGIQLHLGPFDVPPHFEREFFFMVPLANDRELLIERFEITMQTGSHHFLLYTFNDEIPDHLVPAAQEYRELRDSTGVYVLETVRTMFFHTPIVGSQWPFYDLSFPPGVALRLPEDALLDLNSHYINRSGQPATGEVYLNMHLADPATVEHELRLFGLSNYDISLPPGQVTTLEKEFLFDERTHVLYLIGHAHEHMQEFRVEVVGGSRDGELVYIAYDWEHPPTLVLDPPLILERGQGFRVEATYDNWTDRELNFGFLSEDEMMILYGFYYTD